MTAAEIKARLKTVGLDVDKLGQREAVKAFQRSAKIGVDGKVGPETTAAMVRLLPLPAPSAPAALVVTAAQLRKIAGTKAPLAAATADAFNAYAAEFGLATPLRVAHFLAQLCHESDHFATSTEYASGAAYEGRKDLGNTKPGDGKKFRGHGLIQCTGRGNHAEVTVWMRARYPNCPDFVANPEQLALFPWALLSAVWYWEKHKLNALADADNGLAITKKINGGTNGLADRMAALGRAKTVFGI